MEISGRGQCTRVIPDVSGRARVVQAKKQKPVNRLASIHLGGNLWWSLLCTRIHPSPFALILVIEGAYFRTELTLTNSRVARL